MELITVSLVVIGAVLTVLGYFVPSSNRLLPAFIDNFWFDIKFDRWAALAPASVRRFIGFIETMAGFTAGGARTLVVSTPLVVGSAWAVLELSGQPVSIQPDNLSSSIAQAANDNLSIWIGVGLVVMALWVIKLTQGPVQRLMVLTALYREYRSLTASKGNARRSRNRARQRLEDLLSQGHVDDDFKEHLENSIERMQARIDYLMERQESISARIDEIRGDRSSRDFEHGAMRGIFIMFIISVGAGAAYLMLVLMSLFPNIGGALFSGDPKSGFIYTLYLLLPLTATFIILQSLVPSLFVLLNPGRLLDGVNQSARDDAKKADPLGQNGIFQFLFGAAISLLLTYSAFLIGHLNSPDAYVPQTLQMVAANAVCDGLTFWMTLVLMRLIDRFQGWHALPVLFGLLILDLFLAAGLASLSLFIGLLGSVEAITFRETLNILVGLDRSGAEADYGPLFWVMHTAFLPTFGYIAFIFFTTLAKLVMGFMLLITRRAAVRGLMATGGMLGALGALGELALRAAPGSL